MVLVPVPCDIDSPTDPNPLMLTNVGKKSTKGLNPAGFANYPAMQAHAHHLWCGCAFFIEGIEGVFEVVEELIACIKSLG